MNDLARPRASPADQREARLVEAALEIVRETGDFDLPMRLLAARAQVSLRTPYQLFGSKTGVIRAILRREHLAFRELLKGLNSADRLDNIFDRIGLGISFYAREQPLYRALFRATTAFYESSEVEAARETSASFRGLCYRIINDGYVAPGFEAPQLGEVLTDIFAANLRDWAGSSFDIGLAGERIGFGVALALAGVASTDAVRARLTRRALGHQGAIKRLETGPAIEVARAAAG